MYIKPEGVRRAKSPSYAYTIPQQLGSSIMQVPTRAGGKLSGHRGYTSMKVIQTISYSPSYSYEAPKVPPTFVRMFLTSA